MNKERIAKIEEARKRIKRLVDNESVEHRTEIIRNRFIHRLHEFMEKKSISKKDLSESIGTSQSYISQIFNGTKPLNLSTIAKIELKYPIEFKVELRENDNTDPQVLY